MPAKNKTSHRKFIKASSPSIKSEIVETVPQDKEAETFPLQSTQEETIISNPFPAPAFTPVSNISESPVETSPVLSVEKLPEGMPVAHPDIISDIIAEHEAQKESGEITATPIIEQQESTVELPENEKKHSPKFIVIFLVFILGALIGSGIAYVYLTKFSKPKPIVSNGQKPSAETDISPSPTSPTQAVTEAPKNLKKYSIAVLNGSKKSGLAGNLKTALESEGFNVLSAGNATSSSFIETVIRAKTNVDKLFLEKLKSSLEKSFVVKEASDLKDFEKADVIITIGSKIPQTED